MSGDGFGLSGGFIDPASIPESDQLGVDSATCSCGALTLGNAYCTFPGAAAIKAMCSNCGDWIEPLMQDYPKEES